MSSLVWTLDPGAAAGRYEAAGGGSQPGSARIVKAAFTFDTADLAAGIPLYVPAIGDWLYDAWISISVAFDGTTPLGDIGTAIGSMFGVYGSQNPVDMTQAAFATGYGGNTLIQPAATSILSISAAHAGPFGPGRFSTVDPLLVWVSQDGKSGSAAPGGAAGSAVAYALVASAP